MENKYPMTATTNFGLEEILAGELEKIGAEDIELMYKAVTFQGDLETMYRANLELRTALRILKPIAKFQIRNEQDLYDNTFAIEWNKYLTPDTTFAINVAMYSEKFTNSNFLAMKAKDAVVDQLRTAYDGKRPNVELDDPDLRLHFYINLDQCIVSLDSSGNSLHKRGYRIGQGVAPINEVLAAGMIMLAEWDGQCDFIDPMCGSGTMLMEAATIAHNIAPGILNDNFGFMKWNDFDKELWQKIHANAKAAEREFKHQIIGFDDSPKVVSIAKENIKNAELGWKALIKVKRFQTLTPEYLQALNVSNEGVIMMNPPYGERLVQDDIETLYKEIGDCLKLNFDGWTAWMISSNKAALKAVGLRTSKKLTLYNGPLECKFQRYDLYRGSRKSKYLNDPDYKPSEVRSRPQVDESEKKKKFITLG